MIEGVLFLAMAFLVGWFVSAPVRVQRRVVRGSVSDFDVVALEAARDAKLRELRDAELDFATGKLDASDHRVIDATLRAEAAELLRSIDRARAGSS